MVDEKVLEERLTALESVRNWSPRLVSKLENHIRSADDNQLLRINPLKFAADKGLAEAESIDVFLHATSLGLFDKTIDGVSNKILSLRAALGTWVVALETVMSVLGNIRDRGDAVAGQLGVNDEWERLKTAVGDVVPSIKAGFEGATGAISGYALAMSQTGVAIDEGDGWLLHCADAYFHHGQIEAHPSCPPMLGLFQRITAIDNRRRVANGPGPLAR